MSFDQGAWDAITRLQNRQDGLVIHDDIELRDRRIERLEERIAELESRFKEMRKAVWHS